ncbi:hypothetical protein GKN94_13815 [Candidatus Lucifugimonas marina]|jgi:hypothetical protein|nr:hypothetical protein [SAR202 cluster bacterium JH702]MDG0869306.1 hypothetical protein [SAR202 cluster bacterium JH639]WFG36707.1 hypothetical protein GKN94_13815 [SAR202 cluster bacterium JH545]
MRRLGWDASALAGGLHAWRKKFPVVSMEPEVIEPDRPDERPLSAADIHL